MILKDKKGPRRAHDHPTVPMLNTNFFVTTKPTEDSCDIPIGQNEHTERKCTSVFNSIFCKTKPTEDSCDISMGQDECVSRRRLRCSRCVRKLQNKANGQLSEC